MLRASVSLSISANEVERIASRIRFDFEWKDGDNCCYLDAGDTKSFCDAIETWLKNPKFLSKVEYYGGTREGEIIRVCRLYTFMSQHWDDHMYGMLNGDDHMYDMLNGVDRILTDEESSEYVKKTVRSYRLEFR